MLACRLHSRTRVITAEGWLERRVCRLWKQVEGEAAAETGRIQVQVLMIQEAEFVEDVSVHLARHGCISCFIPFQFRPLLRGISNPIQGSGTSFVVRA
jgi:hypothetical protein